MSDATQSRLSIRLKPQINALLDQRARQRKVTKSKLVNEILTQALAPDPWALLIRIRRDAPGESRNASQSTGRKMAAALRAERARKPRTA